MRQVYIIGAPGPGNIRVHVGERGADMFPFFLVCRARQAHFLVRAAQKRRAEASEEEIKYSLDRARAWVSPESRPPGRKWHVLVTIWPVLMMVLLAGEPTGKAGSLCKRCLRALIWLFISLCKMWVRIRPSGMGSRSNLVSPPNDTLSARFFMYSSAMIEQKKSTRVPTVRERSAGIVRVTVDEQGAHPTGLSIQVRTGEQQYSAGPISCLISVPSRRPLKGAYL